MKVIDFNACFEYNESEEYNIHKLSDLGFKQNKIYLPTIAYSKYIDVDEIIITAVVRKYGYIDIFISENTGGKLTRWVDLKEHDVEYMINNLDIISLCEILGRENLFSVSFRSLEDQLDNLIDNGWDDQFGLGVYSKESNDMTYLYDKDGKYYEYMDESVSGLNNYIDRLKEVGFNVF